MKSEAPDDFRSLIQTLENRSDDWFHSCKLSKRPWNIAFWGTLIATVDVIERAIRDRGNASADHKAALLICELKWIRKPTMAREYADRDKDFFKGVEQLKQIRQFLTDSPRYLQDRRIVTRDLNNFKHIHYLLVARDHFKWIDQSDGIVLVDYDVFRDALRRASSLKCIARELLTFNWLPEQGRDFVVRTEYAISNGVVVDSETFYSPTGAATRGRSSQHSFSTFQ